MLKGLGILAGGIFIGAVGIEIVDATCPETMNRLRARIRGAARTLKDTFMEGYYNGLNPNACQGAEGSSPAPPANTSAAGAGRM